MKILSTDLKPFVFCTSILLLVSLLSGCPKPSSINDAGSSSAQTQLYLENAKQATGFQRAKWLLLASESLLLQSRVDKSLAVLNTINTTELNNETFQLYHLLMAQALTTADRKDQALNQYAQITQVNLLKRHQQISYYRDYAELLHFLSRHYESALQRIALSSYLTDPLEIEENRELLWSSLMQVHNLNIYQNSLNGLLISGWLELADLAKKYAGQPDELLSHLEQWRNLYSEHPAYLQMPLDMAHAEASRSYEPQKIALLLPETGKLAKSASQIRDGFLTAIYQLPIQDRPKIQFYDSSQTSDSALLYQQAIDQGANFVIGPLRRESVQSLAALEQFPVPVMSINRLQDKTIFSENFYQFGLPIEDEARQVAMKAWDDGLKKTIVLVPSGIIGERTSSAFSEQFERLGGEVQQTLSYNNENDYARAIQELLGVDKSKARYSKLQQVLNIPLKHEARRRQDTDFIFFKATVKQARRIKPFIDFYYAHDLPLYSTSSIYNGKEDPLLDRDLDNVLFCDIPWLLSDNKDLLKTKQTIADIWPNSTQSRSARLFALGYDLFTLIPDLNKLKNFPQYQKQGLSGLLSVDQQGHIQRELSWAKFVNGKTVEVPTRITSDL